MKKKDPIQIYLIWMKTLLSAGRESLNWNGADTEDEKFYILYVHGMKRVKEIILDNLDSLSELFEALLDFAKKKRLTYRVARNRPVVEFDSGLTEACKDALQQLVKLIRMVYCEGGVEMTPALRQCLRRYAESPFNYHDAEFGDPSDEAYSPDGKKFPLKERNPQYLVKRTVLKWRK